MTIENDPDPEAVRQVTEASVTAAETSTRLQRAAEGMAEAQAWKGQQIAKGWRNLVNALLRRREE